MKARSGADQSTVKPGDSALVRGLVRRAWKANLSTLDRNGGYPYASLVAVATVADGSPLLLLSGLAEHTKNISVDNRASLLFDGTGPGRAALTGARVTLVGRIARTEPSAARDRYLSRHPDAAQFIDFADFALYRLDVQWAHMVAGFGRIVRLEMSDVIVPTAGAEDVVAAEAGIMAHMNDDHADSLDAMASAALHDPASLNAQSTIDMPSGRWHMVGCDPEGIDLTDGSTAVRIPFPQRIGSIEQLRNTLITMTRDARKFTLENGL